MALIEFKDLPDTSTPITSNNLNNNFNELKNSLDTLTTKLNTLTTELNAKMQFGNLGSNPDINTKRNQSGVFGLYNCSQAPNTSFGVLEVLVYSKDWVVQRFTDIESHKTWERYFTWGTTWSSWIQRW